MKLRIARSQQRATYCGKSLVFVPYLMDSRGVHLFPKGHLHFCTACACCGDLDSGECALTRHHDRTRTGCDKYTRNDHKYGYWKEVKE